PHVRDVAPRRILLRAKPTLNQPLTTPSFRSPTPPVLSSLGLPPERWASKVPVNQPRSLLKPRLSMLQSAPRNTGCVKLTSSSKAQAPVAKLRFVHCRPQVWKLAPSRTSLQLHTTVHALPNVVASKAFEHTTTNAQQPC